LQESEDAKKEEPKEADSEKKPEQASSDAKAEEKPDAKSEEKKEEKPADAAKEDATKTDDKAEAKTEAKKRKTHKVEPKRLKVDVSLDGVFVAREMTEVPLRPESWSDYEIVEVVEHGKKVREGETLIKFDDEKLEEAIDDLELEQRLNELAIRKAADGKDTQDEP
jgi:HlyD family secretion protein